MGSASMSLSGNQAKKVVFNGSPSERSGPQSAKPCFFSAGEPASAFEGSKGVVAGTVLRRWNGNGGGRRLGPGVQSSSGAVSLKEVSVPVESSAGAGAETDSQGAQFVFPVVEIEHDGAQIEFPAAETTFDGAQIEYPVVETGAGDGQWDAGPSRYDPKCGQREGAEVLPISGNASRIRSSGGADVLASRAAGHSCSSGDAGTRRHDVLGTAVARAAGCAAGLGRRAKRSQARGQRAEAGSLDSFDDVFLSCCTESPSSRVARVTSALHNLCPVHSSSIPAQNSHARMFHARCVVNSVGDTVDGGRLSCVYGRIKSLSTCTRTGVRRPAVEKLASPQQASLKLHEETWAGLLKNQGLRISQEVEIVPGCAVRVARPSCPDYYPESPGPGIGIRNMLGWSLLKKTERSGVWLFRGALQGENLFSLLDAAGDWERKGSYRTAWSVPCNSSCSCSYAYGHGPTVGSQSGERCWPLLAGVWIAIAPLMKPWCAEGDLPTAANLNLYRGWKSCVGWHCDDEPLFGEYGDAKLLVSVSLVSSAVFRWRRRSCPDDEGHLCCLGHGDILVMDGRCQDKFRSAGSNNMLPPVLCLGQE